VSTLQQRREIWLLHESRNGRAPATSAGRSRAPAPGRHGTQTLIAAFDVATGKIEGVIGNTRTEKDFGRSLRRLLSSAAPTMPPRRRAA
jgi:hypothetical protein